MKITFTEHNLTQEQLDKQYGVHPGHKHIIGGKSLGYTVSGDGFSYTANVVLPHNTTYDDQPIFLSVEYKLLDGSSPRAEAIAAAGSYLAQRIRGELHIDITSQAPTLDLIRVDLEGRVLQTRPAQAQIPASNPAKQVGSGTALAKKNK